MIGYNYRFHPMHEKARRLIAEGRIGSIVALRSVFSTAPKDLPEWKRHRESGGGALLDLACHHLDLAGWLFGATPVAISCSLRSMRSDDDLAMVEIELEGGVRSQTMASLTAVEDDRFEIYGDAGRIVVNRLRCDDIELHPAALDRVRILRLIHAARAFASPGYWRRKLTAGPEASCWRAIGKFAATALEGRSAAPDLADGCRGLAVIEAARHSARLGRTVKLAEIGHESPAG